MSTRYYEFITCWRVTANCEEVYNILSEPENLPEWWPSVYLDVNVVDPGDDNNIGKRVELFTKGWLPYTLRWGFVVTENQKPHGFMFKAHGDFKGEGVWTFTQRKNQCEIRFDWRIEVQKGLLKNLSFLLKPVFSANHRWAMRQGDVSLQLELLRRRSDQAVYIAPPPGPTFPHNLMHNKIFLKRKM